MADMTPRERTMNYSKAGGAIAIDCVQPSINHPSSYDTQPVPGVPKTISFDSSTHSIGSLESHTSESYYSRHTPGAPSHGFNHPQRREPVRGLSRSKSCESHDPFTRNLERSRPGKPDLVRGVARSKSYEAGPCHERRSSRRPEANSPPVRRVSRSKSYDEHVPVRCENVHCRPEPVRGVPRSISYESDLLESDLLVNSRHSSRPSELSNSMHSLQSTGTSSSSHEEFATEPSTTRKKRGSKRTPSKNKEINIRDTKDEAESVKDGKMDAYRAMVNISERTRKKKLNATSYVKITLGNGMAGYVKSVQQ
ncbi:hypothetical protein FisN_13Lh306 [Fistulifera solaris]|uniref:Uncharacterized protein n=1 Tax=Fistulifera solaris TaxID=1519565 RepID=A0A1Z5KLV1_FISSO|nr:hypothetical protein FisN_13Lh306 [Fistulifera solaris]|eukprot:GAX27147.1 hypothetical protein FisN_13Lh306 [Fistulifera solaris]